MSYNRQKVMEYAERYYYDGNPDYVNFDKQTNNNYTDCANFASQKNICVFLADRKKYR